MSELAGLVPINRADFLVFQRQTKYDILLEKLKQTEIIYSEANLAIETAAKNISVFNVDFYPSFNCSNCFLFDLFPQKSDSL